MSDSTPIEDPRNAVGLLTDVLDTVLTSSTYQAFATPARLAGVDLEHPPAARDLGRMFAKGPRKVLNGYRRRNTAELYQQLKNVYERTPNDRWLIRDVRRGDLAGAAWDMSKRIVRIAMDVMEDARCWEKFVKGWTERQYSPVSGTYVPQFQRPPWEKSWSDHQREARMFDVDGFTIAKFECNWRFRDVTERNHRGLATRAAFEAAWLAGQYEFAMQLVTGAAK